jgi:hypothetical protein
MEWAGQFATMGQMRNACRIFLEKPEWKRTFRSPRHRLEDNIKMALREIRWEVVD